MEVPLQWMVYKGKSHLEMDDDWGYPYFGKPPFIAILKKKDGFMEPPLYL